MLSYLGKNGGLTHLYCWGILIRLNSGGGKVRIVLFISTVVVEGSPDSSGSITIASGSRGAV